MSLLLSVLYVIQIAISMPDKHDPKGMPVVQSEQKPLFTFGVIADIQFCDCEPAGTRYYRSSLIKLREAISYFKSDSLDFIVDLGDMIDKDYASYNPVKSILDSSGMKVWHTTGNHDYSVEPKLKKRIPQLQENKDGYYSFNYEKFRFIVLNGNDISTYGTGNRKAIEEAQLLISKVKAAGEANWHEWNGGLGERQMGWFRSQLDEAVVKSEKVIILCHFPVWPENQHNLLNYRDILNLLEKYNNIIAWFNGHNHAGNYGNFNLIHFVTLRGMVETETVNSFAEVEIYSNKIWIKGFGREKSQILAL